MTKNIHSLPLKTVATASYPTHLVVKAVHTILSSQGAGPLVLFNCITRDIQSVYEEDSDSIPPVTSSLAELPGLQFVVPLSGPSEIDEGH